MNKKGQALVEFIIVMPIFILMLLAAFDFVKIIQTKMKLESSLEDLILDDSYVLDENVILSKKQDNDLVTYKLSLDVDITSPFIIVVTDDKYRVTVERTIYE